MAKILLPKDDVHLRLGIIKEARAAGLDWLSQAFLVYQKIRWYETDGKFGFMVASSEALGEQFGLNTRQVELILQHLQSKGLIEHIWCDKKVYRNKTKIWMSLVRLRGIGTSVEAIKVIGRGKKNVSQLDIDPFELKKLEFLSESNSDGLESNSDWSESDSDGSESDSDGSESALEEKQGSENKKENKKESKKENKVDSKRRKVFKKPSIEEVQAYCEERGNSVDPESFVDFYESKGWVVGKSPMKDWKAAVRTWERNGYGSQNKVESTRKDVLYKPKENEDITYKRMFEKWKQYLGTSLKETDQEVAACRELLDDLGEEWVEKLIVALRMRGETNYVMREIKAIQDFVGLANNRSMMMSFYNEHRKEWELKIRETQTGKKPWEL